MLSYLERFKGLALICFLAFTNFSCSGGSGGGGGGGLPSSGGPPIGLSIETIPATAVVGGPYDMPYEINSESDKFLYIATPNAFLEVEKSTGIVRTLAGNSRDPATGFSMGRNLNLLGSNLYSGDEWGRIISVFTGNDNYGTIDLLYNGHLPDTNIYRQIFGNSTRMFYAGDSGIYWMAYGDYGNPHFLTPYPAGNNVITVTDKIIVTENEIFFGAYSPDRNISRYDLNTNNVNTIKTGIQSSAYNPAPMTWHSPYLYWVDGNSIGRYNTVTSQIERIASNVSDYISDLAADDNSIYVYTGYGVLATILKVDILTAQVTSIWNSIITSLTTENGNLYFLGYIYGPDDIIYQITGNNSSSKFITGADLNFSSIGGLTSNNGMLFLTGGIAEAKIATYEISSGVKKVFSPAYIPEYYFYHDNSIISYSYSGSGQLTKIPLDKPLRPVTEISPMRTSFGTVKSMVRNENYFYWIWAGANPPYDYRVSRVSVNNPGPAEDLFQSSSELRDIFIFNNQIYFSCLDNCGGAGWVLTSLPLAGGAISPVFGLGGDPRTFYLNGVFYLANTYNFQNRTLHTISLADGSYSKLLDGLYYDTYPEDIILKASSKWLYIGQGYLPPWGGFTYKISRYQIIDWKSIGPEQTIALESDTPVESLMPSSISTDGKYLYYWDGAIKRLAE